MQQADARKTAGKPHNRAAERPASALHLRAICARCELNSKSAAWRSKSNHWHEITNHWHEITRPGAGAQVTHCHFVANQHQPRSTDHEPRRHTCLAFALLFCRPLRCGALGLTTALMATSRWSDWIDLPRLRRQTAGDGRVERS